MIPLKTVAIAVVGMENLSQSFGLP
jgi:hypothetical protein